MNFNDVPLDFVQAIAALSPNSYLAPLLWQRGFRDVGLLPGLLDVAQYIPTPASAFGSAMERSVRRIQQATQTCESIALWPDFAPDGIATVALLYKGLSSLIQEVNPIYIVKSNDHHALRGLSIAGLDALMSRGITLLIACNAGSQSAAELNYAKTIGLDVIVIDHHTNDRLNTYAHLNSRHLDRNHPFATFPGVAIAYKLIAALYGIEQIQLLDLVAIGMLSDLVEFRGDARYLFQISIPQLQIQSDPKTCSNPGILRLLNHCKSRGDRATDFNSGLGSRIRAFSQIQPDRCIDLLIGVDDSEAIADQAELAHVRLLSLHQEVLDQALWMIRNLDLSMHEAIVLENSQWNINALTSVARTLANQFRKPIFLFSTEEAEMAYGVGQSDFDLYPLLKSQRHLLERSSGHPNVVNLSLPSENLAIFTQAIQHQIRLNISHDHSMATSPDLCVTVAELGAVLFKALRSIEPCGLSNPPPRLQLKNVQFNHPFTRKLTDHRHQPVIYRCTEFKLCDHTSANGIHGNWWGHSQDELPKGACDAIVQLENNVKKHQYEVRLLEWSPVSDHIAPTLPSALTHLILDHRHQSTSNHPNAVRLTTCPSDWNILQIAYRRSIAIQQPLILDYRLRADNDWSIFLGIAKYLARTGTPISGQQWCDRLSVSAPTLQIGLEALRELEFEIKIQAQGIVVSRNTIAAPLPEVLTAAAQAWEEARRHERFRQQYFMQVNIAVLQAFLSQSS
jgi:single-stranded-DNA-specific exonuclease